MTVGNYIKKMAGREKKEREDGDTQLTIETTV
jgi:hypothetical protein